MDPMEKTVSNSLHTWRFDAPRCQMAWPLLRKRGTKNSTSSTWGHDSGKYEGFRLGIPY